MALSTVESGVSEEFIQRIRDTKDPDLVDLDKLPHSFDQLPQSISQTASGVQQILHITSGETGADFDKQCTHADLQLPEISAETIRGYQYPHPQNAKDFSRGIPQVRKHFGEQMGFLEDESTTEAQNLIFMQFGVRDAINHVLDYLQIKNRQSENRLGEIPIFVPPQYYFRYLTNLFDKGFLPVPLPLENQEINFDLAEKMITSGVRVALASVFHCNPTGSNIAGIKQLSEKLETLILDEVYYRLSYENSANELSISDLKSKEVFVALGNSKEYRPSNAALLAKTENPQAMETLKRIYMNRTHGGNYQSQMHFLQLLEHEVLDGHAQKLRSKNSIKMMMLKAALNRLQQNLGPELVSFDPNVSGGFFIGMNLDLTHLPDHFELMSNIKKQLHESNVKIDLDGEKFFIQAAAKEAKHDSYQAKVEKLLRKNLSKAELRHVLAQTKLEPGKYFLRMGVMPIDDLDKLNDALEKFVEICTANIKVKNLDTRRINQPDSLHTQIFNRLRSWFKL
jgi:aspartate/methionine/tyrosine aminotransferase